MNVVLRQTLCMLETAIYGPSYAALNRLIRFPRPLDPEATWQAITEDFPPVKNWIRLNYPPKFARRFLLAAKMKQDHVLGISAHYDVSNEFYELFLDKKYMFYSCADFTTGNETIEEAQIEKANFIVNLIDPKPGEKILELGCGWGPMLQRIFEDTQDRENLFGYTLSKEQVEFNKQRRGFNVEFRNFITCDYPENHFEKIYSIGAWEHVRHRDLPIVLEKLFRALKPGGRMVKHFFCPRAEAVPVATIVGQIYFPGSFQPAYPTQFSAFEKAGFRITHQSIHDYRPTLRAWFDNLVANRDKAIELVGLKTYNKYITFFPASWRFFNDSESILVRFVLEKPTTS